MGHDTFSFHINNKECKAIAGQNILDAAKAHDCYIPDICYHSQLGAIQTCDTCLVEVDGELVRSCATHVSPGMRVTTDSNAVKEAQLEAMSRILRNHELYCTVCDNNNGICTYCGVGCSFEVWTKDRHILRIEPQEHAPVNGVSTCVKGKWGWDFVNSEERLTKPLIRKGDTFVESTWDEALTLIAEKMSGIKDKYGPGSIGYIASSKCSNEENYLFQKFARAIMQSNNVDNCSRYCQSPATAGLLRTVGIGGDSGTIQDIAKADLTIVIGANPAESHPVLATRIKRAHKLYGQKLIVADLRKNELAERADIFLHPNPGTDLIWISTITKYIIDQE